MKILLLISFLILEVQLLGQIPYEVSYKLPKKIEEKLDGIPEAYHKDIQMIDYARIGEYAKALELDDHSSNITKPLTTADSLYCKNFKAYDAIDFISKTAKNEKIVIINEAHHNPRHRVFTTQLLGKLYKQGYRYLGMEALSTNKGEDSLLNNRKYPSMTSGYYISEPQFGNLVREALKIGYTLFSYEDIKGESGREREIGQAKNIKTFIDKHPDSKILIHCGYGHVNEADTIKNLGKAMAGRLKEYTDINPFTISQVQLTEHSASNFEDSYFKIFRANKSSVFINPEKKVFNGQNGQNDVDVKVYHPRTRYKNERPEWLLINGRKWIEIPIQKDSISFPCLALAYKMGESENSIPCDVILIKDKTQKSYFALEKGQYRFKFIDENNKDIKTLFTVK